MENQFSKIHMSEQLVSLYLLAKESTVKLTEGLHANKDHLTNGRDLFIYKEGRLTRVITPEDQLQAEIEYNERREREKAISLEKVEELIREMKEKGIIE